MFEPENGLEALMQAAGKDPDVAPAFYRALLDAEIYILTPEVPIKPGRRRSLKAAADAQGVTEDVIEQQFLSRFRPTSLINRFATTEEVANMVVYVCSEQASATTGAALRVDGGVVRFIA